MIKGDTLSCPSCGTYVTVALPDAMLIVCRECHGIAHYERPLTAAPPSVMVPADWSFVQIGTTGQYNQKPFTVTGRVRLQLRNDYKNLWCAAHGDKNLWIMESFGSFRVLGNDWKSYKGDIKKLRATYTITLADDKKLTGEYVEKCEGVSYEGQIGPWPSLYPAGFFVVQGSSGNTTAFFTIHTYMKVVDYLVGEVTTPEDLKLGSILQWNEWR